MKKSRIKMGWSLATWTPTRTSTDCTSRCGAHPENPRTFASSTPNSQTQSGCSKKIQEHPDVVHMTFKDMKVFYNGGELAYGTDTLDEKQIHDDCILHAVDGVHVSNESTWVAKSSAELNQWLKLLPHNLKPPDNLNPRPHMVGTGQ